MTNSVILKVNSAAAHLLTFKIDRFYKNNHIFTTDQNF
jgi:hypothetical protein